MLFSFKVFALSSDEEDELVVTSAKSGTQSTKSSVDSDAESDKSDVQATRALIEKLSPAKPPKNTLQSRVSTFSPQVKVVRTGMNFIPE